MRTAVANYKALSIVLLVVVFCALAMGAGDDDRKGLKTYEIKALKMQLIRVPPGEFLMGSPEDEPNHKDNEFQHKVRLTRAFYLQAAPVTQAQYAAIMGERSPKLQSCPPRLEHPQFPQPRLRVPSCGGLGLN
jgi:formylglycine-generating enzyme required for sulfatase activity